MLVSFTLFVGKFEVMAPIESRYRASMSRLDSLDRGSIIRDPYRLRTSRGGGSPDSYVWDVL